jgi:hypothetical protein
MPAPPRARAGETSSSVGRTIVPGIGPFLRPLPPRVTRTDLWASVDAVALRGEVPATPGGPLVALQASTINRYAAFVRQAQQYYATLEYLDPVAKPLTGYYFALNLTKAFLVARGSLPAGKVTHGASDAYQRGQRYRFTQEVARVQGNGIFRLLAESTGQGFCYASGKELRIADLLPHLVDAYDLYADNIGSLPQLVPVEHATALFSGGSAWIKLDVLRESLRRRSGIGPQSLLNAAAAFASTFRLVQDGNELTASYEMIDPILFGGPKRNALGGLAAKFDEALLVSRRGWQGGQKFIELSTREELLSQEALIFIVLHHLSNMVRYRPEEVEKLRGSKYFWLFSSWVDRACENYLLSMASRVTFEEHVII